ncbi:MAG: DNA polymerase III subunit beta [Planctomycetota bacterium]|nr:DNA polymerase III subunit beta [Planctomycetota bacterium]
MKVICDRSALLSAINLVSGAVASRSPRVQLTCVKLTATKNGKAGELTLLGTDAELSLRLRLAQVDVHQPGEILVPADKLRQIVSAEDAEPTLTLEAQEQALHIRGADATFKVFGYDTAEYPPIPDFAQVVAGSADLPKARTVFTLSAAALNALVARTAFATARENSRYAINGVLLKRDGKKLEMVATDGRRLALCRGTITAEKADKDAKAVQCIIPSKALGMIQKLVGDAEEHVQIAIGDNQAHFSFGSSAGGTEGHGRAVLSSNLVEGAFPPYEDVIPKDQDKRISMDRDVLSSAVRRAALLTNEESRGVRMQFRSKAKQLELSSRAPEMGEANVIVGVSGYDGEDIEIGFNPQFITDALKVVTEPEVIMELKAPNKAGLLKSGSEFVYVVMPVNLT